MWAIIFVNHIWPDLAEGIAAKDDGWNLSTSAPLQAAKNMLSQKGLRVLLASAMKMNSKGNLKKGKWYLRPRFKLTPHTLLAKNTNNVIQIIV